MTIGVYTIVHTASRKFYIGSSINVEQRLIHHRSKLNRGKHHCRHLQNAWVKYGGGAFEFVLSCVTESEQECRDLEQAVLGTFFDYTYNSKNTAVGGGTGDLNVMRRPDVAKKVSDARIGMKFSDDHRRNLSAALKGKPGTRLGSTASLEARKKMSVAKLGKTSPRKGCVLSSETVKKMVAGKLGRKIGPYKTLTCPHCGKVGAGAQCVSGILKSANQRNKFMSIFVNLAKAKAIAHTARREARTAEFAPLDIKATIPAEAEAAELARQAIRERYSALQKEIDSSSSVEQLKTIIEGL